MAAASWRAENGRGSRRGIHRWVRPAFANRRLPTTPQPDENWWSPCPKWDPVWMAAASGMAVNRLGHGRGIHPWIRPTLRIERCQPRLNRIRTDRVLVHNGTQFGWQPPAGGR